MNEWMNVLLHSQTSTLKKITDDTYIVIPASNQDYNSRAAEMGNNTINLFIKQHNVKEAAYNVHRVGQLKWGQLTFLMVTF